MSRSQTTFLNNSLVRIIFLIIFCCLASNVLLAASISGNVWVDKNNDNIRNNSESGNPFALVELQNQKHQVIDITFADSSSHYAFNGIQPDNYQLCVTDISQDFRFAIRNCKQALVVNNESAKNNIDIPMIKSVNVITVDGINCTLHDALLSASLNQAIGGCSSGVASRDTLVLIAGSTHPETVINLPKSPLIIDGGTEFNVSRIHIIGNRSTIETLKLTSETRNTFVTLIDIETTSISLPFTSTKLANLTVHTDVVLSEESSSGIGANQGGNNSIVNSMIGGHLFAGKYDRISNTRISGNIVGNSLKIVNQSVIEGSVFIPVELNIKIENSTINGYLFTKRKINNIFNPDSDTDINIVNSHIHDEFFTDAENIVPVECSIPQTIGSAMFDFCFPDPAPDNARILGKVWHDRNGDGQQAGSSEGEHGIDSITLQLYKTGNSIPVATISSATAGSLFSSYVEEQGQYHFSIPAGEYFVCAVDTYSSRNTVITTQHIGDTSLDNDFNPTGCSHVFNLSAAQIVNVDLGLVATPVNPIQVSDSCSLEAAIRSAFLGIPAGGCFSGDLAGGETINLIPGSRYDGIAIPLTGNHNSISLKGNGSYIESLSVPGVEAGSYSTVRITNLTIGSLYSSGDTYLSNSTILNSIGAGGDGAVFVSGSTICGVFIGNTKAILSNPCIQSANPNAGNTISGFVWLDNNADGLQNNNEPGFAQTVTGFGSPNISLMATGSTEVIESVFLDENSKGLFNFKNVADGNYYLCMSNEFRPAGLTVTTPNAGDDSIDSDFDETPCTYDIKLSGNTTVDVDLGLVSQSAAPAPANPIQPDNNQDSLNHVTVKTDSLSINHQWRSADNSFNAHQSVIFFSAPSSHGGQRGVARMRQHNGVTEFKFQEWSNLDGIHTDETINLVSIQPGHWKTDGNQIEVGRAKINNTGHWTTIRFSKPFALPPTVILSLQTANGGDAVDVHARNITTESMQVALFEEERKMTSGHIAETVGYLLVDSPLNAFFVGKNQPITIQLPFKSTGVNINHQWKTIGTGYQIRLEEDQTRDRETQHINEHIHVIKVNNNYLTQIASAIGGDPGVLRSRAK